VAFLRQQECALDHIDARFSLADDHLDDVEAEVHLRPVEQSQPRPRAAGGEFLLLAIHRVGGSAFLVAGARLHLGEDERVLRDVAADEIDFTAALRAEIAVENLAAVPAEMFLREPFSASSERMARIRGRVPPGEPGEKTGDGLDKAHAF